MAKRKEEERIPNVTLIHYQKDGIWNFIVASTPRIQKDVEAVLKDPDRINVHYYDHYTKTQIDVIRPITDKKKEDNERCLNTASGQSLNRLLD